MAVKKSQSQSQSLQNISSQDKLWATFSYFPLLGWIYPYFLKKKSKLCNFHSRQALHLNAIFLLLYFIIWIIGNFPLTGIVFGAGRILHPILEAVWIILQLSFLALSGFSAYKAFKEENWSIPYLASIVDKTIALAKNLKG